MTLTGGTHGGIVQNRNVSIWIKTNCALVLIPIWSLGYKRIVWMCTGCLQPILAVQAKLLGRIMTTLTSVESRLTSHGYAWYATRWINYWAETNNFSALPRGCTRSEWNLPKQVWSSEYRRHLLQYRQGKCLCSSGLSAHAWKWEISFVTEAQKSTASKLIVAQQDSSMSSLRWLSHLHCEEPSWSKNFQWESHGDWKL